MELTSRINENKIINDLLKNIEDIQPKILLTSQQKDELFFAIERQLKSYQKQLLEEVHEFLNNSIEYDDFGLRCIEPTSWDLDRAIIKLKRNFKY